MRQTTATTISEVTDDDTNIAMANASDAKYNFHTQQANDLRKLNCEYHVHLKWDLWGSTEVAAPPSTVTGTSVEFDRQP